MIYLIVLVGMFACSCSQLLLKRSAVEKHKNFIVSMLNWRVILAYGIFFASMVVNSYAMSRGLNLKELPVLEASSYIFVPLLSLIFLGESISRRTIYAMLLIICGISIFYL